MKSTTLNVEVIAVQSALFDEDGIVDVNLGPCGERLAVVFRSADLQRFQLLDIQSGQPLADLTSNADSATFSQAGDQCVVLGTPPLLLRQAHVFAPVSLESFAPELRADRAWFLADDQQLLLFCVDDMSGRAEAVLLQLSETPRLIRRFELPLGVEAVQLARIDNEDYLALWYPEDPGADYYIYRLADGSQTLVASEYRTAPFLLGKGWLAIVDRNVFGLDAKIEDLHSNDLRFLIFNDEDSLSSVSACMGHDIVLNLIQFLGPRAKNSRIETYSIEARQKLGEKTLNFRSVCLCRNSQLVAVMESNAASSQLSFYTFDLKQLVKRISIPRQFDDIVCPQGGNELLLTRNLLGDETRVAVVRLIT